LYISEITDHGFKELPEQEKDEIVLKLIDHIENRTEGSILEYVLDFCEQYEYRIEDIGMLIKENKTFKEIIKQDCIYNNYYKNTNTMGVW